MSSWLDLVDSALLQNDTCSLARAYRDHAHGNVENLRVMVRRTMSVSSLRLETRNYMTLLLWKLGWDYSEDLADVRRRRKRS